MGQKNFYLELFRAIGTSSSKPSEVNPTENSSGDFETVSYSSLTRP
jgi:hypothetical protein